MENKNSELEKKLELKEESTAPDSEIVEQTSALPTASMGGEAEEHPPEEKQGSVSVEIVVKSLEEKTKEAEELRDKWLRVCAEFDNYRKRVQKEIREVRELATEALIKDLLPVLDNFERALQHAPDPEDPFVEGVRMIFNQLNEVLKERGVVSIEAGGQMFDPNVHDALAQVESALPEGTVVQVYERGYRMGNHLLRPAKVVVSRGLSSEVSGGEEGKLNNIDNSDNNDKIVNKE
ncbi:MAG: nucleotide exchange factor GrpE [Candidatus Hydrogenedentes bacterium]|nr:nucleotide exchange factor GrpE [Candidatus Hydrogenedentota bacterium]